MMFLLFVRESRKLSQFSDAILKLMLLITLNAVLKLMLPIIYNAMLKLMLPIVINTASTVQLLSLRMNSTTE